MRLVRRRSPGEDGATAVEYGIMIALIAVVIFGAVTLMGDRLGNKYDCVASIADGLPAATVCP